MTLSSKDDKHPPKDPETKARYMCNNFNEHNVHYCAKKKPPKNRLLLWHVHKMECYTVVKVNENIATNMRES